MGCGDLRKKKNFTNYNAMLIEDDSFIRMVTRDVLKRLQFSEVFEATNGLDAINQLEENIANDDEEPTLIDIIICDINMAPMNGMGFVNYVKKQDNFLSDIPILFLTGDAKEDMVHEARKLGVNGYLLKPLTYNGIQDRLYSILKGM